MYAIGRDRDSIVCARPLYIIQDNSETERSDLPKK